MWYDLPVKTSYIKEFLKWHDKYGPIVRIEPNHLHIRDLDAYHEVHKVGSRFDKEFARYSFPFTEGTLMNKLSNKEARGHRDMYGSYFSRSAVSDLQAVIQSNLGKFLNRIDEYGREDKPINLHMAFSCLTADTIMLYFYDESFGALESPNFSHPLIDSMEDFMSDWSFTAAWYFPRSMGKITELAVKFPAIARYNKSFRCAIDSIAVSLSVDSMLGCISHISSFAAMSGRSSKFKTNRTRREMCSVLLSTRTHAKVIRSLMTFDYHVMAGPWCLLVSLFEPFSLLLRTNCQQGLILQLGHFKLGSGIYSITQFN